MKNIGICILLLVVLSAFNSVRADPLPAFPGAEGEGRFATGGRGGTVYEVNNLDNSGPGSLRAAVDATGPRIVVFRVSGTIQLLSELKVDEPYITIAGQTAPGDGICLKGARFKVEANDVIIRYMRFRRGYTGVADDSVWVEKGRNIIFDHCSASWSEDENLSVATTPNELGDVTVQWCMITEGLNYAGHSYGSLIRGGWGNEVTYHHNLYAHNRGRNPRPGNYNSYTADPCGLIFDFRNNVMYNWEGKTAGNNDDGPGYVSRYNFIGNVYIHGPNSTSTSSKMGFRERSKDAYGYFADNSYDGTVSGDPWSIVNFDSGYMTPADIAAYKARSYLILMEPVTTTSQAQAKIDVLADAGATFPQRDAVDERIVDDVINGTGHLIDYESDVGGYPVLESAEPPVDTDHDGMPDEWELALWLDPCDPGDSSGDRDGDGYTNIEEHINWLPLGEPMPTNPADLNGDGVVNFYDFSEFAGHYLSSSGSPLYDEKYDFNDDGVISMADLYYIVQSWPRQEEEE